MKRVLTLFDEQVGQRQHDGVATVQEVTAHHVRAGQRQPWTHTRCGEGGVKTVGFTGRSSFKYQPVLTGFMTSVNMFKLCRRLFSLQIMVKFSVK